MKNNQLVSFIFVSSSLALRAASFESGTNAPSTPAPTSAQAVPAPVQNGTLFPSAMTGTNKIIIADSGLRIAGVQREITITETGCEATAGRHKVRFTADIASDRPITVTMPDGKTLAFRPSFIVLANRTTG